MGKNIAKFTFVYVARILGTTKSWQINEEMSSKVCSYQQCVQMLTNIRKQTVVTCFPPT